MRILYCNKYNYPFSGTEVYLFDLMRLMRDQGHDTALFAMANPCGTPTPQDRYFVPHLDFKDPRAGLLRRARLAAHAIYSQDARRRLGQLIQEFRPDVAHVRNIYHHLSPSILWELRKHKVPVIYHLNDFKLICPSYNLVARGAICERCRGGRFWHVLRDGCYAGGRAASAVLAAEAYTHRWLRTYQRCVDRFVAPSQFVRDKLIEYGWDPGRIEVLPHFQRAESDIPPAPATDAPILYFGRLSAEKGVADLLQAMRHIPNIQLEIAGDGPQRGTLQHLVTQLGLHNVRFVGHVTGKKLEQLITHCRFTVFPSRAYETLGKSILESYALGRAVVASDLGSRREFVREGKTGMLFPVGDGEQLVRALRDLHAEPGLADKMGRAGWELVLQCHSPQAHLERMIAIYQELAGGPARVQARQADFSEKPQLRVAFIGGRGVISKYSGVEAYYEEAGRQLVSMGHKVTVYCRNYFTPPLAEHHGMRLVRLPTVRTKHLETVVHTLLSSVHATFAKHDIVHYHCLGPALFSFIPHLIGKKTVVTVQGLDWQRKKWGRVAAAILRLGEQAAVDLPDATMVVSHRLQDHYHQRHQSKTFYVANGATLRERCPAKQILDWGLEPANYILFLGRFSPEKNCHLLIEAYERIETSVKLVLAGGASHGDTYAASLRRHGCDRIRLLDYVSGEVFEELLTNAMLFVLPSDLEGLSLALLEAMSAGICVLTSDIPENRELVDGVGFTFKPGDAADLERMLRRLIADPEARQQAGERAQQRVREHYLWPKIAEEIEGVYLQILNDKYPSAPNAACGPPNPAQPRVA
jgi:glycosyltransferase involved in cell wall biosynthesis